MTIKVGIIGTGSIADDCHAPAVSQHPDTILSAVLSRDYDRGYNFLRKHNADGSVHVNIESFVQDNQIDLVIIASPDRLHAEHAISCLNAGKHLLLEKPMATSLFDAEEIKRIAQFKKLKVGIGFHLRAHAGHKILHHQILNDGVIGELRHIRAIWAFPLGNNLNWRSSSNLGKWWSLAAVGSHCIDLVRWFGNVPFEDWDEFSSIIDMSLWGGPHDETALLNSKIINGPTAQIVSSVKFGPFNRLELFGSKGHAICEGTFGRAGGGLIHINNQLIEFETKSPFLLQLDTLVSAITEDNDPIAGIEEGLRNTKDLLMALDC